MAPRCIDITGETFGWLTAVELVGVRNRKALWKCACKCGQAHFATASLLRRGWVKSCGCYRRHVNRQRGSHGLSGTPEYRSWKAMRYRCENPNDPSFSDYGGRGIGVVERWRDFETFLSDMGPRPSLRYSIERINVNGWYGPENCRWATPGEQRVNRRDRRRAVLDSMTIEELEAALEEKRKGVLA